MEIWIKLLSPLKLKIINGMKKNVPKICDVLIWFSWRFSQAVELNEIKEFLWYCNKSMIRWRCYEKCISKHGVILRNRIFTKKQNIYDTSLKPKILLELIFARLFSSIFYWLNFPSFEHFFQIINFAKWITLTF